MTFWAGRVLEVGEVGDAGESDDAAGTFSGSVTSGDWSCGGGGDGSR